MSAVIPLQGEGSELPLGWENIPTLLWDVQVSVCHSCQAFFPGIDQDPMKPWLLEFLSVDHLLLVVSDKSSLSPCQQSVRPTSVLAGNLPLSQALGSQGEDQGPDVLKILCILRLTYSWQGKLHSLSMESLPGFVKTEPFQISPSLLPLLGPCWAPASFEVVKMEPCAPERC